MEINLHRRIKLTFSTTVSKGRRMQKFIIYYILFGWLKNTFSFLKEHALAWQRFGIDKIILYGTSLTSLKACNLFGSKETVSMWKAIPVCFLFAIANFQLVDSRTFTGNIYADNWFRLYVNGREVATDPVQFIPHNSVSFTFEDCKYVCNFK